MTVRRPIVLVAGKDPLLEIGGGHSSYVRAHGRAARRAGFAPHVFCARREAGIVVTEFGTLHRVRSYWPFRTHGALSLIEALQAGVPAVASACDGIPEDAVDGDARSSSCRATRARSPRRSRAG